MVRPLHVDTMIDSTFDFVVEHFWLNDDILWLKKMNHRRSDRCKDTVVVNSVDDIMSTLDFDIDGIVVVVVVVSNVNDR